LKYRPITHQKPREKETNLWQWAGLEAGLDFEMTKDLADTDATITRVT